MTPKTWAARDWAPSPALGSRGKEDPDLSGCPIVQPGGRGASFLASGSWGPSRCIPSLAQAHRPDSDALLNSQLCSWHSVSRVRSSSKNGVQVPRVCMCVHVCACVCVCLSVWPPTQIDHCLQADKAPTTTIFGPVCPSQTQQQQKSVESQEAGPTHVWSLDSQ